MPPIYGNFEGFPLKNGASLGWYPIMTPEKTHGDGWIPIFFFVEAEPPQLFRMHPQQDTTPCLNCLKFCVVKNYLGGGNSNIFYFHHYLGKWSSLTNIFQRGWNHQLVILKNETHSPTPIHAWVQTNIGGKTLGPKLFANLIEENSGRFKNPRFLAIEGSDVFLFLQRSVIFSFFSPEKTNPGETHENF